MTTCDSHLLSPSNNKADNGVENKQLTPRPPEKWQSSFALTKALRWKAKQLDDTQCGSCEKGQEVSVVRTHRIGSHQVGCRHEAVSRAVICPIKIVFDRVS